MHYVLFSITNFTRQIKCKVCKLPYKAITIFALETSDTVLLATISVYESPISDEEVIIWDTAPINPGGHYNTLLGAYTAPDSGF